VIYGTTASALNSVVNATTVTIGSRLWHHGRLSSLTPNTVYFYRCISNTDSSEVCNFKTPALPADKRFIRFAILGDTRKFNSFQATNVNHDLEDILIELYGLNWNQQFDVVMNCGDIAYEGGKADSYKPEFFDQYRIFSQKIPTMVAIGNHEYGNDA
jgi:phosphodiesterase/alkaline phosphatase D-like protein